MAEIPPVTTLDAQEGDISPPVRVVDIPNVWGGTTRLWIEDDQWGGTIIKRMVFPANAEGGHVLQVQRSGRSAYFAGG
jgi:hypothetical protein